MHPNSLSYGLNFYLSPQPSGVVVLNQLIKWYRYNVWRIRILWIQCNPFRFPIIGNYQWSRSIIGQCFGSVINFCFRIRPFSLPWQKFLFYHFVQQPRNCKKNGGLEEEFDRLMLKGADCISISFNVLKNFCNLKIITYWVLNYFWCFESIRIRIPDIEGQEMLRIWIWNAAFAYANLDWGKSGF